MFDGLSCGDDGGMKSGAALGLFDDTVSLLDQAIDLVAFLAGRFLAD